MTTAVSASFAYARGEDVVARLGRVPVFSIEGGTRLGRACVPAWTIASIIASSRNARGRKSYLLRFTHDGGDCFCWVDERAIDGVC